MRRVSCFPKSSNGSAVDYAGINHAALQLLPRLAEQWFPGGRRKGNEYLALNPHRDDRRPGSFCINLRHGRWSDFSSGERGGDVISLAAFAYRISQADAAKMLAVMLGINWRR